MIHIPSTIKEAIGNLNGVEALLTAKQWERAAIVYAFTVNNGPGRPSNNERESAHFRLSIREFARLDIRGLSTPEQVRGYRNAWQRAVEAGAATEVEPGQAVEPPDLDWKENFGSASDQTPAVQERVARAVLRDRPEILADALPAAIQRVVEDDAVASGNIARAVADSRAGQTVHSMMVEKHEEARERRERRESYERPAIKAIDTVVKAIEQFYDTTLMVQGQSRSYREVIQFVLDHPELLTQHHLVPTADVRVSLLQALEGMRSQTSELLDQVALIAGEAQA